MISRGEVSSIRELSGDRVQARVCLGSDTRLGSAIVQVELASPRVLEALANLRDAIAVEALAMTAGVIEAHREWEAEFETKRAERAAAAKRDERNAARRAARKRRAG